VSPPSGHCTDDNTPRLECSTVSDTSSPSDVDYQFQVEGYPVETSGDNVEYYSSLPDGQHRWRIRSFDDCGNYSDWSSWRTLNIDTANPVITSAYWGSSYSCNASQETRYYNCETAYLVVRGSNFGDCPSTITADITECLEPVAGARYTATLTRQNSTCYLGSIEMPWEVDWAGTPEFKFSVTITDGCGNSDSRSSSCIDHEDNEPPDPPNLVSPSSGHDACIGAVNFSWSSGNDDCAGLDSQPYRLLLSRSSSMSNPITGCEWTSNTSCSYAFDTNDTGRWYWAVQIRDAAGNEDDTSSRPLDIIEPATISNAYWSLSNSCDASEETSSENCQRLYLIVKGTKFDTCPSSISAHIWEDDLPGARYSASLSRVNPTCYIGHWDPVWEDDGLIGVPEYKFSVEFEDECDVTLNESSEEIHVHDLQIPHEGVVLVVPQANATLCAGEVTFNWHGGGDACSGLHDEPYKVQRSRNSNLSNPETLCDWTGSSTCTSNFDTSDGGTWYWGVVVRDREGNERPPDSIRQLTIGGAVSISDAFWAESDNCSSLPIVEVNDCVPVGLIVQGVGFDNAPPVIYASIWEALAPVQRWTTELYRQSDNCYAGSWTVEWVDDWWFDPEYKFSVAFTDNCAEDHAAESDDLGLEDESGPTASVPVSPGNSETVEPGEVQFTWTDVIDHCIGLPAEPYRVVIASNSILDDPEFDSGWIAQTSFTEMIHGSSATNWYWRVYSRDSRGNETPSVLRQFFLPSGNLESRSPYPIIFVHGITANHRSWYSARDDHFDESILSVLSSNFSLSYGQTIHVTCDHNVNHSSLVDSKEDDVHVFLDEAPRPGDYYLVNFDVDSDGPSGGRCAVGGDNTTRLLVDVLPVTNFFVTLTGSYKVGDILRIHDEFVIVEEVGVTGIWVSRGQFGTDAGFHLRLSRLFNTSNQSNQAGVVKQAYGLSQVIEHVTSANAVDKVILVGHSMGGIVTRYCADRFAMDSVAKVLTINSPNLGSTVAEMGWIGDAAGLILDFDSKSEAVRDLTYHYPGEDCAPASAPGVKASTDNGVFFWGGSESMGELVSQGYINTDINANGTVGDTIEGLNSGSTGAGIAYEFSQLTGWTDFLNGSCGTWDLVIQDWRQSYKRDLPGERVRDLSSVVHSWYLYDWVDGVTSEDCILGRTEEIVWGLDEPNSREFAFELLPNKEYVANIAMDPDASTDVDWFFLQSNGRIDITLTGLPTGEHLLRWLNVDGADEELSFEVGSGGTWGYTFEDDEHETHRLTFGLELDGTSSSWWIPYTLEMSPSTPSVLSSFTAEQTPDGVEISWELGQPLPQDSQRLVGSNAGSEWELEVQRIGLFRFSATDVVDVTSVEGQIEYRLFGRTDESGWTLLGITEIDAPPIKLVTRLTGIHPNPSNPSARIEFELAKESRVQVTIHDVTGRLVRMLSSQEYVPGRHDVVWRGETDSGVACPSGVYFVRMVAGGHSESMKLVILQ